MLRLAEGCPKHAQRSSLEELAVDLRAACEAKEPGSSHDRVSEHLMGRWLGPCLQEQGAVFEIPDEAGSRRREAELDSELDAFLAHQRERPRPLTVAQVCDPERTIEQVAAEFANTAAKCPGVSQRRSPHSIAQEVVAVCGRVAEEDARRMEIAWVLAGWTNACLQEAADSVR